MRASIRLIAASLAIGAFAVGPAAAESFRLSYDFSFGSVLEAEITGALQDDGETVIVSAIENARLDGVAGPALPFVTSLADLVAGTDLNAPVLTLSGLGNDIAFCSDATCTTDFVTFDGVAQVLGHPGVYTSAAFGHTMSGGTNAPEPYDPAFYNLAPQ